MELTFGVLVAAALIFFLSAFIHGSVGFGFPMVATPLLAMFTDMQTAILLTLVPTLLVNLVSIASEGSILSSLRRYLLLAILAMTGSGIGTLILISTESQVFEVLLAIAIIVYLLSDRISLGLSWIQAYPDLSRFIFGISAGLLGGLTNVMAPVLIIYSLESRHSKSEIIQLLNFCFLFGKSTQLILFSILGKFSLIEFSISAAMLVVVSVALFLGISIKKKIDLNSYRLVLRGFLLILAVTLFAKAVFTSF